MRKQNDFSILARHAIDSVREIVAVSLDFEFSDIIQNRLLEEIRFHKETLERAFEFRKTNGPKGDIVDSDVYFREKLGSMISFAEMGVDANQHGGGYSPDKISENVEYYSFLVAKLVVAKWESHSKRPVTDIVLKESSFDNREALQRLVNR
ncbi:MAG TPA: hypothetical protein ENK61_09855 [Devosia sp.]|nr:hypothetical protein [Devosia sp.]